LVNKELGPGDIWPVFTPRLENFFLAEMLPFLFWDRVDSGIVRRRCRALVIPLRKKVVQPYNFSMQQEKLLRTIEDSAFCVQYENVTGRPVSSFSRLDSHLFVPRYGRNIPAQDFGNAFERNRWFYYRYGINEFVYITALFLKRSSR